MKIENSQLALKWYSTTTSFWMSTFHVNMC